MTIFEDYYAKDGWNLKNINEAAIKNPKEFVDYVEWEFQKQIKETVDYIVKRQPDCKILMLAGPSSSGKTTTSNIIKDELIKRGIWSTVISLDDFYVGIARLPLLEDGSKDFESVNSLDINQIKKCLKGIVFNGICDTPIYDFSKMAPSTERRQIVVPKNGVIIIEGLHALNPLMLQDLPAESVLKIYVSVKDEVVLDNKEVISPASIRLMRRVLRDHNFRYTLPIRTVMMWNNVCRGEALYIRPYAKNSDIFINSFHAYEICVMAKEAIELMGSIPKEDESYKYIKDLLNNLKRFEKIDADLIPESSLLKEFLK